MNKDAMMARSRKFRTELRAERAAIKEHLETLPEAELRDLILDLIGTPGKEQYIKYLLDRYDNETLRRALW